MIERYETVEFFRQKFAQDLLVAESDYDACVSRRNLALASFLIHKETKVPFVEVFNDGLPPSVKGHYREWDGQDWVDVFRETAMLITPLGHWPHAHMSNVEILFELDTGELYYRDLHPEAVIIPDNKAA